MREHLPASIAAPFPDSSLQQAELFEEIEAAIHAALASGDVFNLWNQRIGTVSIHAALASGDRMQITPTTVRFLFQSAPLSRAAAFLCRCPSPRPPLHFNSRCLQERQF